MPYFLLDFKATIKHAYYGADLTRDYLFCEQADKKFAKWETAANGWISRFLTRIITEFDGSPREIIACHDMGRSYRKALFPDYKANRDTREFSPIELEQIDSLERWAKGLLSAIGCTQIGVEGVEADDVIAWIAGGVSEPVDIFTVDQDLLQLVSENVIVHLKDSVHHGKGDLKGIPYHLTSIAKSITGDSSDNYPGIKEMGPAKVTHLIDTYGVDGVEELQQIIDAGDIEKLQSVVDETGDKVLAKLLEEFSTWRTMWKVAKLHPELCWKPRARKLVNPVIHKRVPSAEKTQALLNQASCGDLWEDLFSVLLPAQYGLGHADLLTMLEDIKKEMAAGDIVAFDYETSDKDPNPNFLQATTGDTYVDMLSHELSGVSFAFGRHLENLIYLPIDHKDADNVPKALIAELLEHAGNIAQLVVQNEMFEGTISQTNLNMELRGVHDTRIMKRYWDENTPAGLKQMSADLLGYQQATYEETLGDKANMSELTLDEVLSYGIDDSHVTGLLYDLSRLMMQLDGCWDFYQKWAVDPTVMLQNAHINGVNINWKLQKKLHERDLGIVETKMAELRTVLEENVTNQITDGCHSLIEAERMFVFRSAKAKADGDEDTGSEAVAKWIHKLKDACVYVPMSQEYVMPKFALTAKQLTAATDALDLPPIERVSDKAIGEYLAEADVLGFNPQWPADEKQTEFLKQLINAKELGVFQVKSLENKAAKADESGDEKKASHAHSELEKALEAFDRFGEQVQSAAGVEPKLIISGDELNVGSPQQMQQLMYCKIGVPVRLFGTTLSMNRIKLGIKNAAPSTDEKAILTAIANDVEPGSWQETALNLLLEVKSARTRISLYHDKYPLWKHHKTGRIHPSITDAGTDTRRPSGSNPNILQVSKKDKSMRSMFIPPNRDYVCVAIDFAGQELRLMACESGDPVMIDAYNNPAGEKDIHSVTGVGIARLKAKQAGNEAMSGLGTYEEFAAANGDESCELNKLAVSVRKGAKGVNFGMAYGAAAPTLSRNMIVPLAEADELLSGAMSLYARIPEWQEETAKFMDKHGYTLTAFGTKRHANDDLFSRDKGKVSRQHRQGTNATIQGSAAEMLRIALTEMVHRDMHIRLRMEFFAPIYDEVVSFVHKDDVVEYCREMDEIMKSTTPPGHVVMQIPEFSIGPDWGRVHELGRWPGEQAIIDCVERSLGESKDIWETDTNGDEEAA